MRSMSDLWSFGWKVGSAICQSLCTFGQGWVCHMFKGGVLCEAAMCAFRVGPYNALLLTRLFCLGRKGGLKLMHLAPSFLFGGCMTRGAQGGETFMASRCPWDGYQAVCRFDRSAVGRLVVCSFEECHPINRESIPPRRHFLSASPLSGQ